MTIENNQSAFSDIASSLALRGFNLSADFAAADIKDCLTGAGIELPECSRLWIFGNAGPDLWSHLTPEQKQKDHPIDDYSVFTISTLLKERFPDVEHRFLYPGDSLISLQRLGERAGWCRPSKLGVGISPEFGTWFAYRAAVVLQPITSSDTEIASLSPDVCATCADTPCIKACPVNAVAIEKFDLDVCARKRLENNSECARICAARAACPAGRAFRYGEQQLDYHGGRSLASLQKYYS